MHNFTDHGAQSIVCDTATSTPKPPFKCSTDGCISTSNPDTWLALDWVRQNTTFPADCNSNRTFEGDCFYTHAATGLAVQRNGNTLLAAHPVETPPVVRAFHKTGGRLVGSVAVSAWRISMAADDQSFWAMRFDRPEGRISRYATPTAETTAASPFIGIAYAQSGPRQMCFLRPSSEVTRLKAKAFTSCV